MRPRHKRKYRRTKLEIYVEILLIIKKGVNKPTQIMYASNMSWNQFKRTLNTMLTHGHVLEIDTSTRNIPRKQKDNRTKKIYSLTEKGEGLIQYLNGERVITSLLSSIY